MAYALGLPDALRRRGLTVEVVPGWETRSAGSFNPKGAVCHWTAGPAGSTKRPSLNVCVNGRPGLDGPLCNVYGDRNGVAVVVAAGRANHAGTGGWRGLAGNSAVFGTEMESAGPNDFTDAQRWAYPRINAAYCDLGRFGAEMVCGHSEWAGPRKTDINNYPMTAMRAQVAALLAGGDTDMPLNSADIDIIKNLLRTEVIDRVISDDGKGNPLQLWQTINLLQSRQVGYGRRIEDTQARVTALQGALVEATAGIEATIREALTGAGAGQGAVDVEATAARVATAIATKVAALKLTVTG